MLEHLTARNSVHYFCSLVRRRADSESLQAPQVESTPRHRFPHSRDYGRSLAESRGSVETSKEEQSEKW
jgi:hypothetical protein